MTHKTTFHGLHLWHKKLYEKLGYIHLAKQYGYHEKVRMYKGSIDRLIDAIKDKVKDTHDVDRKNDLGILLDHTRSLRSFAKKI
jgi:hypothetical protein